MSNPRIIDVPSLIEEWDFEKNDKYDVKKITTGSDKKVWWIGKCGHKWEANVSSRAKGSGCPFCAGQKCLTGFNDFETHFPELSKEWHPTKNSKLPSEIVWGTGKKVWWIGKCGHEWEASIASRRQGNGCPFCSNKKILPGFNDLKTTNPLLARQWHPTKNTLAPDHVFAGGSQKVWWQCINGHEWQAVLCDRLSGNGCPFCAGKKLIVAQNDLMSLYPDIAKEWNYEKNPDLPSEIMAKSNQKRWWKCNRNHEWQSIVSNRTKGNICPYCSGKKVLSGFNDLESTYPTLAQEWSFEDNGKLLPSSFTSGSNAKVWWIGKCQHKWQATIAARTKGANCPYCSGQKILVGFNDLATSNPIIASEWNYSKNKGLTPEQVTSSSNKNVWWIDSFGHEWKTSVNNRNRKNSRCPYCSNRKLLKGFNDLQTKNKYLARQWDFQKNHTLTPSDVMPSSELEVWWLGNCGHSWKGKIVDRYYGTGCPICAKSGHISFPEKALAYYLNKNNIPILCNHKPDWLKPMEMDIYIPHISVAIEYDGSYWHSDNSEKEIKKNIILKDQGITLIRIREKGLFSYDNCICISASKTLDDTIIKLFDLLSSKYDLKLSNNIDVEEDQILILSSFDHSVEEKSLKNQNPQLATEWDFKKNGTLRPENVSPSSHHVVWWKCQSGHEWKAPIYSRTSGFGCPYCSGRKAISGENDLTTLNPSLAEEWNYELNVGIYPNEYSLSSNKKVWWKGKCGHEWQATINSRSSGRGCPICANQQVLIGYNDLSTTHPQLATEFHPLKNKTSIKKIVSGSRQKVWWKGKCGHEWQASIYSRVKGTGCPVCTNLTVVSGINDLATTHPALCTEWSSRNTLTPYDVVSGSSITVWWKSKCGHEWQAAINSRVSGSGCPFCSNRKLLQGFNDLCTKNPSLAAEWDFTQNTELPNTVLYCSTKKYWWKCLKGHSWYISPSNRTNGSGCPVCKNLKLVSGVNDLNTLNPELAKEWDFEKNNGISPTKILPSSNISVWWKGKCGHEWKARIRNRANGSGCIYCSRQKVLVGYSDLKTTHPDLCSEWNYEKNTSLSPTTVMAGSHKKAWWRCAQGHEWQAVIYSRTAGTGCPICNKIKKEEKRPCPKAFEEER